METIKALFLPLLTFLLLASSAIATVQEVCKMASGSGLVNFNFCVSTLSSAPGSGSATNQGLAVIAGTLSVNQATSLKSKVDSLSKSASNPRLKNALQSCDEVFDNAISTLTDATNAVKKSDINNAKVWFSAGVDAPSTCEQGFEELHLPSPVSKEDNVLQQLASIALSITNSL